MKLQSLLFLQRAITPNLANKNDEAVGVALSPTLKVASSLI
jgi:hypothetical protein